LTAIDPAAQLGGCDTLHAPQVQALAAVGPSTTSWLGAASNPVGHDEA
jgi:hypothetical protein